MAAFVGRRVLIYRGAVLVAAGQSKQLAFSNTPVDHSDGYAIGWRVLLNGPDDAERRSLDLSFEGIARDMQFVELILEGEHADIYELHIDGLGVITAEFVLSGASLSGGYREGIGFSASLQSSGPVIFGSDPSAIGAGPPSEPAIRGVVGRKLRIYREGVLVASARSKQLQVAGAAVDHSDGYATGWRRLLTGAGEGDTRSIDLSIEGVVKDLRFVEQILDKEHVATYEIEIDGIGILSSEFFLTNVSLQAGYRDAAQFSAQLQSCGPPAPPITLTSKPYAIQIIEGVESAFAIPYDPNFFGYIEGVDSGFDLVDGQLRMPLVVYDDGEPEAIETTEFDLIDGELRVALKTYTDGEPEAVETTGFDCLGGELRVALITYTDGVPEAIETTGFDLVGGSLT